MGRAEQYARDEKMKKLAKLKIDLESTPEVKEYLTWSNLNNDQRNTARNAWLAYYEKVKTGKVYKIYQDMNTAIKKQDSFGVGVLQEEVKRIISDQDYEFVKPNFPDPFNCVHKSEVAKYKQVLDEIERIKSGDMEITEATKIFYS